MDRLLKKFETAKELVPNPIVRICPDTTRIGAIYYGSTAPAMSEAWERLAEHGTYVDLMRVRGFPFNESVRAFIDAHDQVFIIEQNRDAQLRMLIVNELEIDPRKLTKVLHYDGSPITARIIAKAITDLAIPSETKLYREAVT
jgi:2-oxoglutarate ferredoxin oxidoreductase subunit alpha